MKSIETTVYQFDELSEEAKEEARNWYRDGGLDYEWYDGIDYDAKEIGKLMGIRIDKIYFSGFSSQGDGACFEGYYSYEKGSVKKVMEYAPQDQELHRIVKGLAAIQKINFYGITASVKHRGHYYHQFCTDIDVMKGDPITGDEDWPDKGTNETITELLRDLMAWIYKMLDKEYEYLLSDESVDETIKANEYTFTEDGKREG